VPSARAPMVSMMRFTWFEYGGSMMMGRQMDGENIIERKMRERHKLNIKDRLYTLRVPYYINTILHSMLQYGSMI